MGAGHDDFSDHERKLLVEYKSKEQSEQNSSDKGHKKGQSQAQVGPNNDGHYEKSAPVHGDIGFHKFVKMIKKHPGQVLRLDENRSDNLCALKIPFFLVKLQCCNLNISAKNSYKFKIFTVFTR